MGLGHSPRIVTDGLVLALDAGNTKSYPGSGTTWTDISRNGNNGTLVNGVGYFGLTPPVSNAYSVSVVTGGSADFTSSPDGSNTAILSNIFDGTDSTYFYNATSNFDVTVTLVSPITYTSRTVSVYHATLNAVDFITTAGTVTAQTGGSSTGTFTYTNLLPAGGTLTGIRFYTLSSYTNNTVVSITIDGELLNLFTPTPQTSSYFEFDGSNDYVDIGASSDFNLGSDNWCIEFFIKTSTKSIDNSYNRRIYMTDGPSGNTSGNLQIGIRESLVIGGDNKGVISLFDTSESPIGSGSIEVSDDSWHHIAVTRIGSLMNVYVDGVFDFTVIMFGGFTSLNSGSPRLRIGAYTSSSGRFDGRISNFKFYKGKGLTAEEVQQNYNALKGRYV